MTDDVAALVLRDNYFQTQVLSVTGRIAPQLLDAQQRFMQFLEKAGRLNRAIEFLPSDEEIAERRARRAGAHEPRSARCCSPTARCGSTTSSSPRRCPTIRGSRRALARYFPRGAARALRRATWPRHPLKREIIATHVTNSMLNRVGSTFVHRLLETTGARPHEVVRAYLLSREIFGFVAAVEGDRGARQQGRRRACSRRC